ncbi:BREX-1 system adenine-specific DNA-methyltransferase PglX [Bacteroides sp.]|uniref:BREX-1 system adenine-specific DNA-methyltransferase PglX n=1 Tax=Bacteroides sp. TaxID=29523 RepID=UPI00262B2BFB|nr:BREX-1 system adenine-specific DNA-methyltransferase PglX [Bacteroides sp.]MDD3041132.1 BREX-1 system adenine-specific DNA-methyltransferase PglX [Bacteroides sp.]
MNAILPELFEKTNDYTELLMNVSFTDKDGLVYQLVNDIQEDDFNVVTEGQVEIIGWLYQYYNTEPKDETFALLKKNVKITKERIPAATQLFTPDWIVRYMVENSLGRLWINHLESSFGYTYKINVPLRNESGERIVDVLKSQWKYYLDEVQQTEEVEFQIEKMLESYRDLKPEYIKVIDPCMGSGHILVYAFDVLMQIYQSAGWNQREAAQSILTNNLYGLDIDNRAYQLAYFAVMMKARQYDRRILTRNIQPNVHAIQESNAIGGAYQYEMGNFLLSKEYQETLNYLLEAFKDAKEYGSILQLEQRDYKGLAEAWKHTASQTTENVNITFWYAAVEEAVPKLIQQAIILTQKYDVVVTNPPYMGSSGMNSKLGEYVKKNYPDSKSDLFAVFIERSGQMTKNNCYQAMITQHAWMFLSSFEKLRKKILQKNIVNMAHLGPRAFEEIGGEVVQTTTFVLRSSHLNDYQGSYTRLVDYGSQQEKESAFLTKIDICIAKQENFTKIPGAPFAYWASKQILDAFITGQSLGQLASPKKGLATTDNKRFLRMWHEIAVINVGIGFMSREDALASNRKWFPLNKGGDFRRWYGNKTYLVNWFNDGSEMKTAVIKRYNGGSYTKEIRSEDKYFKNSITWSALTAGTSSFRHSEYGALFDSAGSSMFPSQNEKYILGLLNTKVVDKILRIINPTLNYGAGSVATIPVKINEENILCIKELVDENVSISRNDWDNFEVSWDFMRHPFLTHRTENCLLIDTYGTWKHVTDYQFAQLKANEEKLNRIFIDIYGLQDELIPEIEDKDVTIRKADLRREICSFISYAVGCMFGRYSLDVDGLAYAGGEWDNSKYSTFISDKDNILPITDEEYFEDDIVGLFCDFLKKTFGAETLEENLDFIAKALGNKGNSSREIIRNYFLKDFYKDHCTIYQKRPIYWLFDSGKADGFKALVYMHRYNADTIGNLRIDYLHRMQRIYESEISRMQETIENSTNAREVIAAQKRKEKLTKQLKETKDYDEKIAHLALARISIDLDDGVKINYEKVQTGTDGKKLEVLAKI